MPAYTGAACAGWRLLFFHNAMSTQVWKCDKCGRLTATQEEADQCEAMHLPIMEAVALSWSQPYWDRPFPKTIKVTVDVKDGYNYALYDLRQIGPKGV